MKNKLQTLGSSLKRTDLANIIGGNAGPCGAVGSDSCFIASSGITEFCIMIGGNCFVLNAGCFCGGNVSCPQAPCWCGTPYIDGHICE